MLPLSAVNPTDAAPRAPGRPAAGRWLRLTGHWSIRARLLALVASVALPMLTLVVAQTYRAVGAAERAAADRVEARLRVSTHQVEEMAGLIRSAVALVEAFAWPELPDVASADHHLSAIRRTLPAYVDDLAVASPDGRLVASSRNAPQVRARIALAGRPYFAAALASRDVVVSEPFEARVDPRWLVVFAKAIRDPSGRPRAVAIATVELHHFSAMLRQGHPDDGSRLAVLSPGARVVAEVADSVEGVGQDVARLGALARIVQTGAGAEVTRFDDREPRVSAWATTRDAPWVVYVGTPLARARDAPLSAGLLELAMVALLGTLGVAVALAFRRHIAVPLRLLQDGAARVAAGDYAARVPVRDRGELGALERDFNGMVERIQQADARRHDSEDRLQSLLELSNDWYWEQDAALRFTHVTGERFAAAAGRGRWDLPYAGVTEEQRADLDACLARREAFRDFEMMRPDVDGEMRWVAVSGEPVFGPDGAFRGYRGVGRDIDRRRRAELALRRGEARLRALVEAAGSVLWVSDDAANMAEPQAAFERYTGMPWEKQRGLGWFEAVHPDDRAAVVARMGECIAAGNGYELELRLWSARHRMHRRCVMRAVARRGPGGGIEEWVGSFTDVHEQRSAEAAHRVSEERLAAATRAAGIGVFDHGAGEGGVFFSDTLKALLGFGPDELADEIEAMASRVHPADLPAVRESLRRCLARPSEVVEVECRLLHRDGRYRWLRAVASVFPGADGAVGRLVGAALDVTERREREAELAESRERIRAALAAGGLVDWEWRVGDARTRWGERVQAILGPRPEGVEYPELIEMVHPEDRVKFLAAGRRSMEAAAGYRCDFRIVWLDGSVHWIKSEGAFEPNPVEGRAQRMIGVAQDVTERVIAGERLKESEARYRAVLETTTDTVVMVDASNRIDYVNPAVQALLGWTPGELQGRPLEVLQPPEMRAIQRRAIRAALMSRKPLRRSAQVTGLARDGREVPIEVVFSRIDGPRGRYFVGFLRDITQRKQAEAALHEANASLERRVAERTAELQAVNRELESFSYTVAHDLRAPLRAIDGFSQVLEEELSAGLGAESRRYMHRIRANTRTMAQMIDELLEFSRIGRAPLSVRPVELAPLVAALAEELAHEHPRARIECEGLPAVQGDATLLRVVLANLMGNALKFSATREAPVVRVSGRATAGMVEVSVADNGVGFDPAFAHKLFGVFQRLHSQQEFEGSGIGLATVARIVARHGGHVGASSRPGEGATFTFCIPAARP